MSEYVIRGIPAQLVDHFWKLAEPFVKRALDHATGEFKPADVKMFCKDKALQLWMVTESDKVVGVMTTELVNYPQKKHCRVLTFAGKQAPEWGEQADTILTTWAKEQGCQSIEAYVRKGFVPVLNKFGYEHKFSVVFKDLKE